MEFELKYGEGVKTIRIPRGADVTLLQPEKVVVLESLPEALNAAVAAPLGCEPLSKLLRLKRPARIAIAIPDETRPTPVKVLLPIILEHVYRALPDLDPAAVKIVIGGGLHPPANLEIAASIIPPNLIPGCVVVAHDAHTSPMSEVGTTRWDTPVKINTAFTEADFKMVIGQIDPHQFVGFTGGSKGIVIGCGAPETIQKNHSLMFEQNASVGHLVGNPVREDLNEAGRMIGIDFAVNVVLNADKAVVHLGAGDPDTVLADGALACAALYGVAVEDRFDIVIASCGGAPKDIVLYQAQKGLNLSSHAVKKGGKILLLAACQQGIGDDVYFDYVCQFATPAEVLKDFKKIGFTMGAHKAYLFGRTLVDYDVAVFSDLDPVMMKQCHLRAADPSNIIREWVDGFGDRPKVAIVPYANTTYFYSN